MRARIFRRRTPEPVAVIATYNFSRRSARLVQLEDGRVRWVCDCDTYQKSAYRDVPPWCKHVSKAAARRSVERLTGERPITRQPRQ
jgi:hypothetical protein